MRLLEQASDEQNELDSSHLFYRSDNRRPKIIVNNYTPNNKVFCCENCTIF